MKHIILTTIAAVVLVGCGEFQQSTPAPEVKPVDPVARVSAQPPSPVESQHAETVVDAAKPEQPTAKAPDISIHDAALFGNIEAIKQHLAAGTDVNARTDVGTTPLFYAAADGHKEIAELLIAKGADVNAKSSNDALLVTPLDAAIKSNQTEFADLLREHGGKTGEKLKAVGK